MDKLIEQFNARWQDIEGETLSVVRRQLTTGLRDLDEINSTLKNACKEWTEGRLGASIWYSELTEKDPEKAKQFKENIDTIEIKNVEFTRPSNTTGLVSSIATFVIGCCLLSCFDISKFVVVVLALGLSILTWTIFQSSFNTKNKAVEDQVVNKYQEQLRIHYGNLKQIIQ